eukprot:8112378-Karenia_brevis.AAC.1
MHTRPSLVPDLNPDSDDQVDDAGSAHTTHHQDDDLDPISDTEGRRCNVVMRGQQVEVVNLT